MEKAQASTKNNTIHKVLGVLQSGEKNSYKPEEIVTRINTKFKKYSIHEVGYAARIITQDGYSLLQDSQGKIIITSPFVLASLRESYNIKEYKEIKKWWVWPAQIFSACVGVATIVGVVDSIQSPALRRKIEIQQHEIESLVKRATKDSLKIDSLYKMLSNQKPDTTAK